MKDNQKKTVAYYLPEDVREWIDLKAKEENRSPSNYLTNLIRSIRGEQ